MASRGIIVTYELKGLRYAPRVLITDN